MYALTVEWKWLHATVENEDINKINKKVQRGSMVPKQYLFYGLNFMKLYLAWSQSKPSGSNLPLE